MKLSRAEIFELAQGLKDLDGRVVVEKDANGAAVTVKKPFTLSASVRYAIGRNMRAIKANLEEIDDKRQALFDAYRGAAHEIKKGTPEAHGHQIEWNKALREEVDFNGHTIAIADLKIEDNQLDPSTLNALMPILSGEL